MRPVYRHMVSSGSVLSSDMMTIKHTDEPSETELDTGQDLYDRFMRIDDQFAYLCPSKTSSTTPELTKLLPHSDPDTATGVILGRKLLDCYTIEARQPVEPADDLIAYCKQGPPVPDLSQISSVRSPSPTPKLKDKIYRALGRHEKPQDLDNFVSSHTQVRTFLESRSPGGGRVLNDPRDSWRGEQSALGGLLSAEVPPQSSDYSFQQPGPGDKERDLSELGMLPLLHQTDLQPSESFEDWVAGKQRPSYSWSQDSLT